jgi:predicted phage terminase large subunit-like protein
MSPDREERLTRWWHDLDDRQRRALLDHPAVKARLGATFVPTAKQLEAEALLDGPATHVLLWGGSRSGKTAQIMRKLVQRAMRAPGSRHLVARLRFNHVVQSIWFDTLPKVMATCFPGLQCKQDKAAWFWELPNGSQIWFGGLDDKERTEKVLGNEYATVFLNECSQIGLTARNTVITRLAQNVGLKLLAVYDENPPVVTHWTHRLFIEKRAAQPPYKPLANPEAYASLQMNPADNAGNLPASYLEELQALPARERLRFWEGKFGDIGENALWSFELIEKHRVKTAPVSLQRIVVAVDPSGTKGDDGGDTVGIIVAGLGLDGEAYVLEDASVKAGPAVWGKVVTACTERWGADEVIAETNFGGAMVEAVVQAAASKAGVRVRYKEVKASRGKVVRAEPISALYEQGKVHHVGGFPQLEDQLAAFSTAGYMGDGSPDRADALVWAITEFFPRVALLERSGFRRWPAVAADYDPLSYGQPGYARQLTREAWALDDEWEKPWLKQTTSGVEGYDPFDVDK